MPEPLTPVTGFGKNENDLLIAIALYKIRRFLETGLRLRTACDFECVGLDVKRPQGFSLPEAAALEEVLPGMISAARDDGGFTAMEVTYRK